MSDLERQYQQAILVDLYGPSGAVQRLAGLTDIDVDARFDAMEPDAGIVELLRPSHRHVRALLELVAERIDEPAGELAEAVSAITRALSEMEVVEMTDREKLLSRLDELVADIRSLDDVDAIAEVVSYIDRVVMSVWPAPMPDDVADAVEREVGSLEDSEYEAVPITPEIEQRHREDMRKRGLEPPDDPTERRLQLRQERDVGLLGPGPRLAHLVLADVDRDGAAEFAQSLVTLAEGRDDVQIRAAVAELRTTLRKIGGDG